MSSNPNIFLIITYCKYYNKTFTTALPKEKNLEAHFYKLSHKYLLSNYNEILLSEYIEINGSVILI